MSDAAPEERPIVSLLAAVADNGVIGRGGALPWHLPADLRRVKALTVGHTLIMGRKTFASIGKPLPKRRSIVLSRDPEYRPDGVEVAAGLDQALAMARAAGERHVFVFGGAGVFAAALPLADRLYLTRVHAEVEGDVRFPAWDPDDWQLIVETYWPADERHAYPYTFSEYRRRRADTLP